MSNTNSAKKRRDSITAGEYTMQPVFRKKEVNLCKMAFTDFTVQSIVLISEKAFRLLQLDGAGVLIGV
jgi:hypothetical protein